jgi:prophage regulatory protein
MNTKILRLPEVMRLTGLGRSSIYIKISDGCFPKQIPLGVRSVGWLSNEIENWINRQISIRDDEIRVED